MLYLLYIITQLEMIVNTVQDLFHVFFNIRSEIFGFMGGDHGDTM